MNSQWKQFILNNSFDGIVDENRSRSLSVTILQRKQLIHESPSQSQQPRRPLIAESHAFQNIGQSKQREAIT